MGTQHAHNAANDEPQIKHYFCRFGCDILRKSVFPSYISFDLIIPELHQPFLLIARGADKNIGNLKTSKMNGFFFPNPT